MSALGLPFNNPNDHRWGVKRFRLTFRQWAYETVIEREYGGNCPGFENLSGVLSSLYDDLPNASEASEVARLTLKDSEGEELWCDNDEDEDGEEWLAGMLVAAELVSVTPERPKALPAHGLGVEGGRDV